MGDYKEDTNKDFRTIFFIILFSLFVFASLGDQGSQTSYSVRYHSHYEVVYGDISSHGYAILCKAVSFPDLQKYYKCALHNTGLNPFSIQNKISDYNRRIAQNFILIQKARLSKGPVLPLRLYFHLQSNRDDYLPVLS